MRSHASRRQRSFMVGRTAVLSLSAFITLSVAATASATNGINVIAVGFEENAMGGADVAISRDPLALNSNPAGLANLTGFRFESQAEFVQGLEVTHADSFNEPTRIQNERILVGNLGVSYSRPDWPVTIGASLAAQGGVGVVFRDLTTAFGTRDDLSTLVRIAKATVGAGGRVTDRLSVGAGVALFYADANQKVFAGTSAIDPTTGTPFFGTEVQGARTISPGIKIGAQYKLREDVTLGLAYTGETELRLSGEDLAVNFTAIGLGKVHYSDVVLGGLHQPHQVDLGGAWQATDHLLIAAELDWLNWADAIDRTTLTASHPDNPAAPAFLRNEATQNWNDQIVLALGAAYTLTQRATLYAGVNHASNPVPREHTSPLLGGTAQTHLTGGAAWQWSDHVRLGVGLEYLVPVTVSYTNPQLSFLPNSRDHNEYLAMFLGLSLVW